MARDQVKALLHKPEGIRGAVPQSMSFGTGASYHNTNKGSVAARAQREYGVPDPVDLGAANRKLGLNGASQVCTTNTVRKSA